MKQGMSMLMAAAMTVLPVSQAMAAQNYGGGSPWIDTNIKANVTAAMETSPKEDFHLYVNKDWLLQSEIPAGYSSNSCFMEVQLETDQKVKEILSDSSLTGHNAKLVQGYYQKFLDWGARNAVGLEPLKKKVEQIQALSSMEEVSKLISSEEGYFMPNFLDAGVITKFDDASVYTVGADSPVLLLGDAAEYKTRTSLGSRYYDAKKAAAVKMLVKLGYTAQKAEAMFDDVITLEGKMAEVIYTSADIMATDYYAKINNIVTLDALRQSSPVYPVAEILTGWGYGGSKDYMFANPAYLAKMNELYTVENLDHIKNYMIVHSALKDMQMLDQDSYAIYTEMNTAVTGAKPEEDETAAYKRVRSSLTEPINQVYLEKYDSRQMKQDITTICKTVIAYYRTMLAQEDWLSEATKAKAIEKLDNIKIHAAYPEKWYDYSTLDLGEDSYYDATMKISRFDLERSRKHVNQKVDPDEWNVDILDCNAFYSFTRNSINIMTGILGGDFYWNGMKEEELYAGIGSVVGHEISHAFDTKGAQFDETGTLKNWWTEEDLVNFNAKADRLAAYYDHIIPYAGEQVRGASIQTEAIADMAGTKAMLSMMAAKQNADYDLFFRSYARIWKKNNTTAMEEYYLTQDNHPLQYLRTNVTLQQFDEFLRTYDIHEGDTMYLAPEDRILVW